MHLHASCMERQLRVPPRPARARIRVTCHVHARRPAGPHLADRRRLDPLPIPNGLSQYTVAAGLAKKKNPKSGSSTSLMGYKVGDRAPDSAKNSGTTKSEQNAWNKAFGSFFSGKDKK